MILPLALLIAAALPLSSTNEATQSSPVPSPTPNVTHYKKKARMLALIDSGFKSIGSDEDDELVTEFFDGTLPSQQNINPNNAMPGMPHTINELKYASGFTLGGPREYLSQHGVDFATTYTGLFAGNPVGGLHPGGFAYLDNISLTCLIQTEKLFGWPPGGNFVMSAVQQDGGSKDDLSKNYIGNQYSVNNMVGGTTIKWVYLYYEQKMLEDRVNLILGRVCAMDEFNNPPIAWNYVGKLNSQFSNQAKTSNPNATWGSRLKVKITKDTEARIGIYQITATSINGLNWDMYPTDSVSLFAQYSWNPSFCKPGSSSIFNTEPGTPTAETATPNKEASSDKSFKSPVDLSAMKQLPGHYYVGSYYTFAATPLIVNPNASLPDSYAFYCHADQMVYRPNPLTDAGLICWTQFAYSPESSISAINFQAKGGSIYTGLIPGRRNDFTIFGIGYGRFNPTFSSFTESQGKGDPIYEVNTEFGYRINFTRFFYIQPDIQWIINPGGEGHIPNALVLATQVGIVF